MSLKCARGGLLVVIEGIDGSGKTTVAINLVSKLNEMGFKAVYTHEPTDSPIIDALRKFTETYGVDPRIEALVIAADRIYHVDKIIVPLINSGYIVVSDRYVYSSIAYQGGLGVDIEWIKQLNRYAAKPDVAIYLRVSLDVALSRLAKSKRSRSPLKYMEDVERLKKAIALYERLVAEGELVPIDAERDVDSVVKDCLSIIMEHICDERRSASLTL